MRKRLLAWPASRLGEALEALAVHAGLAPRVAKAPAPPAGVAELDDAAVDAWLKEAAAWLGVEVEAVSVPRRDLPAFLERCHPALLRLESDRFLLLSGRGGVRRRALVLAAGARVTRIEIEDLAAMLSDRAPRARGRRRDPMSGFWLLRARPGRHTVSELREAGLTAKIGWILLTYTLAHLAWVASWWILGRGVLEGRFDPAALHAWTLLLLSLVPIQIATHWNQGRLAIGFGALLRQRLLAGTLRLDPDDVIRAGAGRSLARILELEAFESLSLTAGFTAVVAVIDLAVSFVFLSAGAAGWLPWVLAAWLVPTLWLGRAMIRQRESWTGARERMTQDLVERLTGHLTRLVQEPRGLWHDEEDWQLDQYHSASRRLDRIQTLAFVGIPRGWLLLGLAAAAPVFALPDASRLAVATSLAGILLAYRALDKARAGFQQAALALVAWRSIRPLYAAAARPEPDAPPTFGLLPRGDRDGWAEPRLIVEVHDLVFTHRPAGPRLLDGVNLEIHDGERVLLEGASGSGKSTLASLLLGLRHPQAGVILLHGLDRHSIGPRGWRARIAAAPQFHDNHMFSDTLAFNLLMGRRWPPRDQDLDAAERICRELGLGPLLERMPAGLDQVLGDRGWQLSHGEQSLVYLARALLQGAELLILDESFAALDPETLRRALDCVFRRAPALLVIAHP